MRPRILQDGYRVRHRLLFWLIRRASGHQLPDAAKLTFYRSDFYGRYAKQLTHQAMRGPSTWLIGDRELIAAYISAVNDSPFCVGAHTATAAIAFQDRARVAAVLADLDSAPIDEGLRATLRLLATLAGDAEVTASDIRPALAAGVTPEQIEDALAIGFAFNTTSRLANAFAFEVLSQEGFDAGARYLLKRGYR